MRNQTLNKILKDYLFCLLGGFLYAATFNILIFPLGLYSGNLTGVAHTIRAILTEDIGIYIPTEFNLTGILLWGLNIPLFMIAYKVINRDFFIKTLVTTTFQSFAMFLIPIFKTPLINDMLTACILGGIISAYGTGLILRHGGSGGGTDILGIYCAKKFPGFSIGKISILISALVFTYCFIKYDPEIVIYSAIFTVIYAIGIDKTHYQNIKITAIIFTKTEAVMEYILRDLKRGVTCWKGYGAYKKEDTFVYMTIISKFEAELLKKSINEIDPQSFIVFNETLDVSGNFEKRL